MNFMTDQWQHIPPISPIGERYEFKKIGSIRSVEEFKKYLQELDLLLPCDEEILTAQASPLAQKIDTLKINGRVIGNRWAIQPMEGWDGTKEGEATEITCRRWKRFGESGAKLIFGGEAMAVRYDGRANPYQLVICEKTKWNLHHLLKILRKAHKEKFGIDDDLVVGFQLTHSGRFSKPEGILQPRVAYRHPILDQKFGVTSDKQVLSDEELESLVEDYVKAARIAYEVGADFVDIKHCHGYLLHELLSAYIREGKFGGGFENRTRMLRLIVEAIRADNNPIEIAVRLSAFDTVPFRKGPTSTSPGIPEDYKYLLPYKYGFGLSPEDPLKIDLTETIQFIKLCHMLGIRLINITAGSPYYNPHIQRPAGYPPIDGYNPPNDPLIDVYRQIVVVRELKKHAPKDMIFVGSAYSYLQEFLPHVAQAIVREGWTDVVGIGRMALSYPHIIADTLSSGRINRALICRTFSDCTTAPRLGLRSGCYPLDKFYTTLPDFKKLKEFKSKLFSKD